VNCRVMGRETRVPGPETGLFTPKPVPPRLEPAVESYEALHHTDTDVSVGNQRDALPSRCTAQILP
jgi:hypothetical protein